MAQSFGVPARDIVRKVTVPGALPGVLAGFRISSSIALILVVAADGSADRRCARALTLGPGCERGDQRSGTAPLALALSDTPRM